MKTHRILAVSARYALVVGAVLATGCSGGAQENGESTPGAQEGLDLASRVFEASDPARAYSALSDEERVKVDAVTLPASLEVSESLVDANGKEIPSSDLRMHPENYSGCYGWHQTYKRTALLGNTLYTYWQTTSVCVSNGTVTGVSVTDAGGETSTPGWRIDKGPDLATKNVGWEGRGVAHYHFVFGTGGWDVQHPTDCVQQRLNGNGHDHLSSGSCDLG
jgi:hypothetical protein